MLIGYAIGCGLGFAVGVAIDRSPFLQRGLLPLSALASTVPLIGIAPIMVMWFGFDWPSKAAVVVLMTFFPMLVNTLAGLKSAGPMELDLMRSLRRELLAHARVAAPAGRAALRLQRPQDQLDAGADRRYRRRVLRLADLGPGLPHLAPKRRA